jgi:hypothetical protein
VPVAINFVASRKSHCGHGRNVNSKVLPPKANLLVSDQHYAEPCFSLHHASVGISSLFERNCLDHRPNVLEDAEGKGVLAIYCLLTFGFS